MSTRWDDWVHVMCSTRGHWLPGDPRGFRDHDHRVHSSGDYQNLPPPGEHARLYRYAKSKSQKTIYFVEVLRKAAGEAIIEKFDRMKVPARAIAVGGTHVHALVRVGIEDAKPLFGLAKQFASHQLRKQLPGTIWGEGCFPVRIRDEGQYRTVVGYILDHEKEGAWVWEHPTAVARQGNSGPAPGACHNDSSGD